MVAYKTTQEQNDALFNDIDDFIYYLREGKGSSENTLQAYIRNLSRFADHLKKCGVDSFGSAGEKEIASYKKALEKGGFSVSSISQSLSAIRSLYSFLMSVSAASANPAKSVHNQKQEQTAADVLTRAEADRLMSRPDANDIKGLRDKAMMELLYSTGIKASELISLDTDSIDLNLYYVRCSKNEKERYLSLDAGVADLLSAYLDRARPVMAHNEEEKALFVNVSGGRMTRQGLWKILKTYGEEAGITKAITPHTLRHSYAAHLVESGESVDNIKELLGHTDVSSTLRYTQRLNVKQNKKAVKSGKTV